MYILLTQFVLARRNDEVEGWMNVLFVIVMAVVWVLGGILKAKSNKAGSKSQMQPRQKTVAKPPRQAVQSWRQSTVRPQGQPATKAQSPQYRPGRQSPPAKTGAAQPLFRALAAQIEQAARARMAALAPQPDAPPHPKPKTPKPPVSAGSSLREPKVEAPAAETSTDVGKYPIALLLDHEHPDDLRRAILYYEILGKPLSLRDSYESVIGL